MFRLFLQQLSHRRNSARLHSRRRCEQRYIYGKRNEICALYRGELATCVRAARLFCQTTKPSLTQYWELGTAISQDSFRSNIELTCLEFIPKPQVSTLGDASGREICVITSEKERVSWHRYPARQVRR